MRSSGGYGLEPPSHSSRLLLLLPFLSARVRQSTCRDRDPQWPASNARRTRRPPHQRPARARKELLRFTRSILLLEREPRKKRVTSGLATFSASVPRPHSIAASGLRYSIQFKQRGNGLDRRDAQFRQCPDSKPAFDASRLWSVAASVSMLRHRSQRRRTRGEQPQQMPGPFHCMSCRIHLRARCRPAKPCTYTSESVSDARPPVDVFTFCRILRSARITW